MSESISLVITFIIIAIAYEYLKPKNDDESTNQPKDSSDAED
jgi:preprotein translocase subunit SecG